MAINDIFVGKGGKQYRQVGEDEYVPVQEAEGEQPVESSIPQPTSDAPTGGEIVKGITAEIAIASAGQLLGASTGALYPVIAFGSGVLGSLTAQSIEGRDDYSVGRSLAAGFYNLIPGSKAVKTASEAAKLAGKTLSTGEKIAIAAKAEAKRGAVFGAGEATAISVLDEGQLPSFSDLATYSAGGAAFGGALGAAGQKLRPTFDKFLGKSVKQVDEDIATGVITAEDIATVKNWRPATTPDIIDAEKDVFRVTQSVADDNAVDLLEQLGRKDFTFWDKLKISMTPSGRLGDTVSDLIFYGAKQKNAALETNSKLFNIISEELNKNPDYVSAANAFLDTKIMPDNLLGTNLEKYLLKFQSIKEPLQQSLLSQISTQKFSNMSNARQKNLINTINESLKPDNQQYVRKDYGLFLDPDFVQDPKLRQDAINELKNSFLQKASRNKKPLDPKIAEERAIRHINRLTSMSARSRAAAGQYSGMPADSVLKSRKNPGQAERAFLGEITNPAQRIRGTLDNLSKTVYRNKTEILLADALKKANLAIDERQALQLGTDSISKLKLRGNIDTGLYVPNDVQFALGQTYLSGVEQGTENLFLSGIADAWQSAVSASKGVKVILNPPSYSTNIFGAAFTMLGQGMNPFSRNTLKGLKLSLSEYNMVEKLASGKTASSRIQLLDDIEEMKKYGLADANVEISDIQAGLEKGFASSVLEKAFSPFAKAYQGTDTAFRYSVWKNNQNKFRELFPTASDDAIKAFAAKITNDTYQNYDKLSPVLRQLSRWGVLPQFVAFTAEFSRNMYNQTRYAKQMIQGTFGEGLGNLGEQNIKAMRAEGLKRLSSLLLTVSSVEAIRRTYNSQQGVGDEEEAAIKETMLPDWDKTKSLLFVRDEQSGDLSYINMSYIVPHAIINEAINAGLTDQPLDSISDFLINNFVGEGQFVTTAAINSIQNKDKYGKNITNQVDGLSRMKDKLNYIAKEAFKPGVAREADKLIDALTQDEPQYSVADIMKRQVGYRINKIDQDKNSMFKVKGNVDAAKTAKSSYTSALKYDSLSPLQRQDKYNEANQIRKDNLGVVYKHIQNLNTLGYDEDEIIDTLKKAGMSSKDIISSFDNKYIPIDVDLKKSTGDMYDELSGNTPSEKRSSILQVTDLEDRKKLLKELKNRTITAKQGLDSRTKLIKNMSVEDKVSYIINNPDKYWELRNSRVITSDVQKELVKRRFRPPQK
tara:strand:+ start:1834 stop:5478 length:3645 start_codon:yes stop_codon:yes gene_type:complete